MFRCTAEQVKKLDWYAQNEYGIPGIVLMENAGLKAAEVALNMLKGKRNEKVTVFCGPGNNAGDGFVLARHLINHRIKVNVFILVRPEKIRGDALVNYNILLNMKASIYELASLKQIGQILNKTDLIVDAIFGIGLNKKVEGIFKDAICRINSLSIPVLSLDTPSGLSATTGKVFGVCVHAHSTVTFGVAKKGFFIYEGPLHVGELILADISWPQELLSKVKIEKSC